MASGRSPASGLLEQRLGLPVAAARQQAFHPDLSGVPRGVVCLKMDRVRRKASKLRRWEARRG